MGPASAVPPSHLDYDGEDADLASSGWGKGLDSGSVSIQDFELMAVVGQGGFGKVWKARKRDTGEIYAIKIQHLPDPVKEASRAEQIDRERSILESIKSNFVSQVLVSESFALQRFSLLRRR